MALRSWSGGNALTKIYNREIHGSDRYHRRARPQRIFKKIPKRLCFRLSSMVAHSVLEEGHVFLGFTKCGQFVVSYSCQIEPSEHTALPTYIYKLQWWWFVPNKPLSKVSEVRLFGEEDIVQDLYVIFCQWPEDHSKVLVFGHSLPSHDQDESCQCFFTITAVPSLAPCAACRDIRTGSEDLAMCLRHCFCVHTKYELTPPFPMFCPRVQLKCDGNVILNTGDSLVALHIQLDQAECDKAKGPSKDKSFLLKVRDGFQNYSNEKSKEMEQSSADRCKESVSDNSGADVVPYVSEPMTVAHGDTIHLNTLPYARLELADRSLELSLSQCQQHMEDQKENTSSHSNDVRLSRSPRSPKSMFSQTQRSPTNPCSPERWFDRLTYPTSPSQNNQTGLRRARAGCSTAEVHPAKDLYSFDSDDGEDSSCLSFMCPTVPKYSMRSRGGPDLLPHQNLVISPSFHVQRQLAFNNSAKSSPLVSSQPLNCLSCDVVRNNENILSTPKNSLPTQRAFFSPSNSENSYGGTSSTAESVILQVNHARTVTYSWRKFVYQEGNAEVDTNNVIEDDFDLAYRSVLPAEVRGSRNKVLSLCPDSSVDDNTEVIGIKQLTFDIEHYMEEVIRGTAEWGHQYIAFTNYDLQILDVDSEREEVLAKVFALISAREEGGTRKSQRSKGQEKLYQTSFTFEVNINSGAYETLIIENLTEVDEKDLRKKEWKPGFRECSLIRRQTFIPQSTARSVHVLSNESVFKGKSLQMILLPGQYTAIIL